MSEKSWTDDDELDQYRLGIYSRAHEVLDGSFSLVASAKASNTPGKSALRSLLRMAKYGLLLLKGMYRRSPEAAYAMSFYFAYELSDVISDVGMIPNLPVKDQEAAQKNFRDAQNLSDEFDQLGDRLEEARRSDE